LIIPVQSKGCFGKKISEIVIADKGWTRKHWRSIVQCYVRAPCFNQYREIFEKLYCNIADEIFLSHINYQFISTICDLLGVKTKITKASDYELVDGKTMRLVHLCQQIGATEYLTGTAAKDYLNEDLFNQENISVRYMDYSGYPEYEQFNLPFQHEVSILDLLFHKGSEASKYMKSFR
jgi:hypothetical protein